MNQQEYDFYHKLIPVLTQADWNETGATGYDTVKWWLNIEEPITVDNISANVRIGIILLPNHIKMFVRLDTIGYPSETFTQELESSSYINLILMQANFIASRILQENKTAIQAKRLEFEKENSQQ